MLTVKQAAVAGRCSPSTILTLVHRGTIKGTQDGPKHSWRLDITREAVREVVRDIAPRSGFRKTATGRKAVGDAVSALVSWANIEEPKRQVLLELARKYNVTELETLLDI